MCQLLSAINILHFVSLQVLAGLPVQAERRGKSAKHSHSISTAAARSIISKPALHSTAAAAAAAAPLSQQQIAQQQVDAEAAGKWGWADVAGDVAGDVAAASSSTACAEALAAVAQELQLQSAETLQAMACHSCGCPALVTLLRVLAHSDSAGSEHYSAHGECKLPAAAIICSSWTTTRPLLTLIYLVAEPF
jgi:hypothetical protein